MSTRRSGDPEPPAAPTRRRLAEGQRAQRIVEEAARYFAEVGFRGTTRELARRLGVSQPLLYRYFPDKQALIDRVYATVVAGRWREEWTALLADRTLPLDATLKRFYRAYSGRSDYTSLRLFMYAGLDRVGFAGRYAPALTGRILEPVVDRLRADRGLPSLTECPMLPIEREIVMALHGGIVFIGIRKHIYGTTLPEDRGPLIDLHVDLFLDRAGDVLARCHEEQPT